MSTNAITGTLGSIHGELRFLFALIALAGILRTVYGLARDADFTAIDERLALGYAILLDIQALFGIALLVYLAVDRMDTAQAIDWVDWHPVWMLAAVFVAHLGSRWKGAPDQSRFRAQLAAYSISLVLIIIGVFTSPLGSWV
jgi:hypothetical protein